MKLHGRQACVYIRKLQEYCLNSQQPRGRHTARVFAAVGIPAADADELRIALLRDANPMLKLSSVRSILTGSVT